jgi:hypothetical protein
MEGLEINFIFRRIGVFLWLSTGLYCKPAGYHAIEIFLVSVMLSAAKHLQSGYLLDSSPEASGSE